MICKVVMEFLIDYLHSHNSNNHISYFVMLEVYEGKAQFKIVIVVIKCTKMPGDKRHFLYCSRYDYRRFFQYKLSVLLTCIATHFYQFLIHILTLTTGLINTRSLYIQ